MDDETTLPGLLTVPGDLLEQPPPEKNRRPLLVPAALILVLLFLTCCYCFDAGPPW